MTIEPSAYNYLRSISAELASKSDRIRHLIGDSHFLTDGHHKEYILQSVLGRFLPSGYLCSRGFVVRDGNLQFRSKEQDLLIVDCRKHAPLFHESGVIVTFPENVRAVISVKSTIDSTTVSDALEGLESMPDIPSASPCWRGVFGFQIGDNWSNKPELAIKWLKQSPEAGKARLSPWTSGAIACDSRMFITVDRSSGQLRVRGYHTELSTALFVAELIDHIASTQQDPSSGINDLLSAITFDQIDGSD